MKRCLARMDCEYLYAEKKAHNICTLGGDYRHVFKGTPCLYGRSCNESEAYKLPEPLEETIFVREVASPQAQPPLLLNLPKQPDWEKTLKRLKHKMYVWNSLRNRFLWRATRSKLISYPHLQMQTMFHEKARMLDEHLVYLSTEFGVRKSMI